MMRTMRLGLLLAVLVLAGACGGTGDDAAPVPAPTPAPATIPTDAPPRAAARCRRIPTH